MATAKKRPARKAAEAAAPKEEAVRPSADRLGLPRVPEGVPQIYADLVMDAVYGIHTTKVILGEETGDGAGGLRPKGVIVIPTAVLLDLCRRLLQDLTRPEIAQETAQRYADVLRAMRPIDSDK